MKHATLERKIETERGAAAVSTWYVLQGDHGAVQFMVTHMPILDRWWPLDLGVHSHTQLYDDHLAMQNCEVLGGDCFFSPSIRMARDLWESVGKYKQPVDAIWLELEALYLGIFDHE